MSLNPLALGFHLKVPTYKNMINDDNYLVVDCKPLPLPHTNIVIVRSNKTDNLMKKITMKVKEE